MAAVQANPRLGERVRADPERYVLHSWSVQNAIELARCYARPPQGHRALPQLPRRGGRCDHLAGDPRHWVAEPSIPGVVHMFDPHLGT